MGQSRRTKALLAGVAWTAVTCGASASTSFAGGTWFSSTGSHEPVIGDTDLQHSTQLEFGVPQVSESDSVIISRKQYALSWSTDRRVPLWVGWGLQKRDLGAVSRSNVFRVDHDLDEFLADRNQKAVRPDEYQKTCLDRGHQAPSGDRTASLPDNQATFYMSNMTPQSSYLNRRTWLSLERFARRLVEEQGKELSIYAGSVFGGSDSAIGPKKDIQVPKQNYKILVIKPAGGGTSNTADFRLLVVSFDNLTSKGTDPLVDHEQACYDSEHYMRLSDQDRRDYWRQNISSLEAVEQASGISFPFLKGIQALTPEEIDQLVKQQQQQLFHFQQVLDDVHLSIPSSFNLSF